LQTAFAALLLMLHLRLQETEVADGSLHVCPTPLSLQAVIDDRRLADALEEAVDAFGAVATADAIDAHWHLKEAEPLGVGVLADIAGEVRGRDLAVVGAHCYLVQHPLVLGNEARRRTTRHQQHQHTAKKQAQAEMSGMEAHKRKAL
jgi:hypothetical protein